MFKALTVWLEKIATEQPAEMMLGLDRIKVIAERLDLLNPPCPVIIVGGTNGKGSTVAALDAIYRAAGYRVGTFTSPILFRHNEYVHIDGIEASDNLFCQAYQKIAEARGEVALTPFEYHTLAALWMFKNVALDVIILEVGLGGRLDAVNIIDADVAIVTSIDIDHADWLGETREKIGFEKAGIFRSGKFAICGDENPPQSLIEYAKKIGSQRYYLDPSEKDRALRNMACVRKAVIFLKEKLPVTQKIIDDALKNIKVTGRVQIIPGDITEIYDVSHNPAAVAYLAKRLSELTCTGKTVAVFSMLVDKDIASSIKNISSQIEEWYIAPLAVKRGADMKKLKSSFTKNDKVFEYSTIEQAYLAAKNNLHLGDRIVIFGSFHTVAAIISMRH